MTKSSSTTPTSKRKRHTNSKLGCANCKRKKIRCDESLPLCKNCLKGKKDTCSYLSLSQDAIEKIKLTHSLRNCQNKLLNSNYRLPATNVITQSSSSSSSSRARSKARSQSLASIEGDTKETKFSNIASFTDDGSSGCGNILEFKFELADLPVLIPSITYPPLQYNNLSMQDFTNEFKVINDFDSDDYYTTGSPTNSQTEPLTTTTTTKKSHLLPNGFEHQITFNAFNPRAFKRVNSAHTANTTTPVVSDYSLHLFIGKNTLLDYMSDLVLDNMSDWTLSMAVQLVGIAIHLNHLRSKPASLKESDDTQLVQCLENHVANSFDKCCCMLQSRVQQIQQRNSLPKHKPCSSNEAGYDLELAAYTGNFLTFTSIMLKMGVKTHFETLKLPLLAYNTYAQLYEASSSNKSKLLSVASLLKKNLQYNVISVNVPSYNPQFLFEIESNLRSLEFIFTADTCTLFKLQKPLNSSSSLSMVYSQFETLKSQYSSLMKFIKDKVLNIVFALRDESSVSVYPINALFDVLQTWHAMCPPQALVNNNNNCNNNNSNNNKNNFSTTHNTFLSNYDESVFINTLSTTLYSYYSAVASSLDAVFPSCKYLFSLSFILPVSQWFSTNKENLTVPKYNPYIKSFHSSSHGIDELLQRHIIYASRLYAFFKRRFVFYHNNIKWCNYYGDETLQTGDDNDNNDERMKSRKLTNVNEVAIKSFNTTLIRPEHYPTRDKSGNTNNTNNTNTNITTCISFTREDDPLVKNLYARNIETLDIFNESSILQFDYESMLLLKDYRSFDDECEVSREVLSVGDIRDHYEDRIAILTRLSRDW